ncbi:hypothetical protein BGW80DRAFT_1248727 [Lactifluus volemus]|nr:hypothetical protein BGW80DRAFT_1248727 [Lactifluus volemus]
MTPEEIAHSASHQLLNYNYIFPQGNSLAGAVMRTRPYRNPAIIRIIRDMYFVGGNGSFASRHASRFASLEDTNGLTQLQVPKAMVAFVATAYYAALSDWRGGNSRPVDFTTNTYHDVYLGHIGTMEHIESTRLQSFQKMMADIYERANAIVTMEPTYNIAAINLEELDV